MKNIFTFFALTIVLLFNACTKEELFQPEITSNPEIGFVEQSNNQTEKGTIQDMDYSGLLTTVEVTVLSSTQSNGELIIDFSGSHDFSNAELDGTQFIVFEDTSGNESTLAFLVNGYSYGNGVLQVAFEIAANNLSGLDLKSIQHVIIDDQVMN